MLRFIKTFKRLNRPLLSRICRYLIIRRQPRAMNRNYKALLCMGREVRQEFLKA